ncbi:MAG: VanZ family protein [bacterium]
MKRKYWFMFCILWAALTFRLTTTPNLVVSPDSWLNSFIMNGSHFGFFGVQAALLYFSLPKKLLSPIFTLIAVSAFGYWIEVLQLSIPGRSYDLKDWALDTIGAVIFLAIIKRYVKHDK